MSFSNYLEAAVLNALRGTPFSVSAIYAKLHLADPGENGTNNAAVETTRKVVTFGVPVDGVMVTTAPVVWTGLAATETFAGVSLWDAVSGGNCLGAGTLTASGLADAGGSFTIATGDLSVTLD